jgi:MtN3 and saliva related transmembrane protein
MNYVSLIGFGAGVLCAIAYIPQILKILREKSAEDISLKTMLVLGTGLSLWVAFGVAKSDTPIIIGNAISLSLVMSVIILKFRYG